MVCINFFHFISLSSIGVVRFIDVNHALDIQIEDILGASTSFFSYLYEEPLVPRAYRK
jgi:hypothetical protein